MLVSVSAARCWLSARAEPTALPAMTNLSIATTSEPKATSALVVTPAATVTLRVNSA